MTKFFVGQRVRLVVSRDPSNAGAEGRITHIGSWGPGERLPNGRYIHPSFGMADLMISWDRRVSYGLSDLDHGPCKSDRVEPILPEGSAPSEHSFSELMDSLRETVK